MALPASGYSAPVPGRPRFFPDAGHCRRESRTA